MLKRETQVPNGVISANVLMPNLDLILDLIAIFTFPRNIIVIRPLWNFLVSPTEINCMIRFSSFPQKKVTNPETIIPFLLLITPLPHSSLIKPCILYNSSEGSSVYYMEWFMNCWIKQLGFEIYSGEFCFLTVQCGRKTLINH